MRLRRIDALQLHEHGPLVVPPAPVLKQRRIFESSVSVAISNLELVLVIAERTLLSSVGILTFKLGLNYKVCCAIVILSLGCGASLLLFLFWLLWSINIDFSELGDLLFSFLPDLWICLFLESLQILVRNCEFESPRWQESTHRALPLKVHTCLRATLTEDVLAWEFRWPHHDHHTDRAFRCNLEINVLHCSHLCFLRRHAFNFFFLLCNALFVCPVLFISKSSQPFTLLYSQEQVPLECCIIERSVLNILSPLPLLISLRLLFGTELISWHLYHGRIIALYI